MRKLMIVGFVLLGAAACSGSKATCEDAVKKMASLDPDGKGKPQDEIDKKMAKMTERCKEKAPPQEVLDCVMKAGDFEAARACDKK